MVAKFESKIISYSVFIIAVPIILLSLLSIIFPAFLISIVSTHENELDSLEIGPLAIPVILANSAILIIGLLYYKNKLPSKLQASIKKALLYDTSPLVTITIVVVILFFYIGFSISELFLNEEEEWGDFVVVKKALQVWPSLESEDVYIKEQLSRYVRMALLVLSQNFLGNIKLLPFVSSILLVLVTFFITKEITKKRLCGVFSMLVLLQSYTFLKYDTVAVYENFWSLFYIFSLYVIYKKWYISPISYILSIFSKAIVISYLPMSLFYVFRSQISKQKKIIISSSYLAVIGISFLIFSLGESVYTEVVRVSTSEFWIGFSAWAQQMRFDYLILFSILPLTVGLFLKSKNGLFEADSIIFFFVGTLVGGPILALLTDFYFIHPYRFIPFIVFFAMGVGIITSRQLTDKSHNSP